MNAETWPVTAQVHFSDEERAVIQHLFPEHVLGISRGSFHAALIAAAFKADIGNLQRLARGFPDTVAAVMAWQNGDLSARMDRYVAGRAA